MDTPLECNFAAMLLLDLTFMWVFFVPIIHTDSAQEHFNYIYLWFPFSCCGLLCCYHLFNCYYPSWYKSQQQLWIRIVISVLVCDLSQVLGHYVCTMPLLCFVFNQGQKCQVTQRPFRDLIIFIACMEF